MINATIDGATKDALNSLSESDVSRKVSYAYEHEILWYGIDAVAHVQLMRMARAISEGNLENSELIEQGIRFGRDMWQTCVSGFQHSKNGNALFNEPAQPQHVTEVAEKLIRYYSALVNS